MVVTLLIIFISTIVAYILYTYKRIHSFYDKRGIKYIPGVPVFGNIFKSTILQRHYVDDLNAVYKAFPDEKYVGFIDGARRTLIIRDPELIRMITVKNFDHFVDRKILFDPDIEPIFGASLLMLKGDRWRDMRTTLSPAFTGSKIKHMVPFMINISSNIINHLKDHVNQDIDINDLMRRFATDVIASTAFGVEVDSLKERHNDFYKSGQNMFNFSIFQNIFVIFTNLFPLMCKNLGIKVFPKEVTNFFKNVVEETMEYREKNNIVRPDMLQLLTDATKGTLNLEKEEMTASTLGDDQLKSNVTTSARDWSKNELIGQVFVFFIAGFDTTSSVLTTTVHELALNPDVQEKLYQGIKEYKEINEELKFNNINSMKYLDCVIHETMRKWSPTIFMDRTCTKPYELPPPREGVKPVQINPGDLIFNLMNSIHMDPKYHPNPEVFDPDRFADDKKNIEPFTYMPFGMGPRSCIGSRFALLEIKILLFYLISNFKILKCPKTLDPIKLKPHSVSVTVLGGSWIRLQTRE